MIVNLNEIVEIDYKKEVLRAMHSENARLINLTDMMTQLETSEKHYKAASDLTISEILNFKPAMLKPKRRKKQKCQQKNQF